MIMYVNEYQTKESKIEYGTVSLFGKPKNCLESPYDNLYIPSRGPGGGYK